MSGMANGGRSVDMTVNTKKAVPKDLIDSLLADYKRRIQV